MTHSFRDTRRRRTTALMLGILLIGLGTLLTIQGAGIAAAPVAQQGCDINNLPDVSAAVVPKCGPSGTTFLLTVFGFQANEPLSFWYTDPDGNAVGVPSPLPGGHPGRIDNLPIATGPGTIFRDGIWAVTIQGTTSGHQAIGRFRVGSVPEQTATPVPPTATTAPPTATAPPASPTTEPASPTATPINPTLAPTETMTPAPATSTPPAVATVPAIGSTPPAAATPIVAPTLPPSLTVLPTLPPTSPTMMPTPTGILTAVPVATVPPAGTLPGMPRTGGGNALLTGLLLVALGLLLAGWGLADNARNSVTRI